MSRKKQQELVPWKFFQTYKESFTAALAAALASENSWVENEFRFEFEKYMKEKRAEKILKLYKNTNFRITDIEYEIMKAARSGQWSIRYEHKIEPFQFEYWDNRDMMESIYKLERNLIESEVHRLGSELRALGFNVRERLLLPATPHRFFLDIEW